MSLAPRPMPNPPARVAPRVPCEVLAPARAVTGVSVRWRVLRRALDAFAPDGTAAMVELRVGVYGLGGRTRAWVSITDPQSGSSIEPLSPRETPSEVIPDIRGEVHIEAPGWLHATIAPDDAGRWRLVYARSPLLETLRIPGGRAEVIGVEVV